MSSSMPSSYRYSPPALPNVVAPLKIPEALALLFLSLLRESTVSILANCEKPLAVLFSKPLTDFKAPT